MRAPLTAGTAIFATIISARAADIELIPPAGDAQIAVVTLSGLIETGDADRFEQRVSNASSAIVYLDSDGGSLIEGLRIGEYIRAHGYATAVVETRCASSCGLVWAAGSVRIVSPRAQIGFHSAFRLEDKSESGEANALVGAYLTRLGYGYDAIAYMTQARPAGMQWLSYADAARLQIVVTEATPELVAIFNNTTMGREGTPPGLQSAKPTPLSAPQISTPQTSTAQARSANSYAAGSFPLVPGGLQGTPDAIVGRNTERS